MRPLNQVIPFLLVVGLALGCTAKNENNENSVAESKQSASVAAKRDKAMVETRQAVRANQAYAFAMKADFVSQMQGELAEVEKELEQIAAKIERTSGAVRADAKETLGVVREKWILVNKQLDQAKSATESSWDDAIAGVQKSYGELQTSFDETRQWLSDKIEP